jgi:glycerol-3-phosphate dehydrogenase
VRPLPFILPVYRSDKRGATTLRLGMLLYDLLSLGKSMPRHRKLSPREVASLEPALDQEDLVSGFLFHDCQAVFPERLCIDNVLEAQSRGALALNHTQVSELLVADAEVQGARLEDCLSGEKADVRGRIVVNAAGPWVDQVCRLGNPQTRRRVGGTIGSHLVVSYQGKGPSHAVFGFARSDNRAFFIIPWLEYHLIGTTDIRYDGSPDDAQATDAEVDYLTRETNRLLPQHPLTPKDILYAYAGVRALPPTESVEEGAITRKHLIHDHQREDSLQGLISLVGGKLTNVRKVSRDVLDVVAKKLQQRSPALSSPKGPATDSWAESRWAASSPTAPDIEQLAREHALEPPQVEHLATLYGPALSAVLSIARDPHLHERICPHSPDIRAQIVHAVEQEGAATLADALLRRTGVGLSRCLGLDCASEAAQVMARCAGWDEQRTAQRVAEYQAYVRRTYQPRSACSAHR